MQCKVPYCCCVTGAVFFLQESVDFAFQEAREAMDVIVKGYYLKDGKAVGNYPVIKRKDMVPATMAAATAAGEAGLEEVKTSALANTTAAFYSLCDQVTTLWGLLGRLPDAVVGEAVDTELQAATAAVKAAAEAHTAALATLPADRNQARARSCVQQPFCTLIGTYLVHPLYGGIDN